MIQNLIDRYKRLRTSVHLRKTFQCSYAFVGMGQHSLTNLYPVLQHLGIPLKYICVISERKAKLIERKYLGPKATTSLDSILADGKVKGVFVAASPSAHFSIASQILMSGKSLFIEKPPCQTLEQLDRLIQLQRLHGSSIAMVGLQKRYSPALQLLNKRLAKEKVINYDLHYLTGSYPEGNALPDLYIHPIDMVCHLFGHPQILACKQIASHSYVLMFQHKHVIGTLELSTAYSWTNAEETLKVCTRDGVYLLKQMQDLTFMPHPSHVFDIPTEKLHVHHACEEHLVRSNNFIPTLPNNQVYAQGYYNEIVAFTTAIEKGRSATLSDLPTLRPTYETMLNMSRML